MKRRDDVILNPWHPFNALHKRIYNIHVRGARTTHTKL